MASIVRAAATAATRVTPASSKALLLKSAPFRRVAAPLVSRRIASAMWSLESLRPLHSAIASARLRSFIAVDSSCWSWLSRDFATPR